MPREQLLDEARKLAADIAAGAKPRQFTLYRCLIRVALQLICGHDVCLLQASTPFTLLLLDRPGMQSM